MEPPKRKQVKHAAIAIYARDTSESQEKLDKQIEQCKKRLNSQSNVESVSIYTDFREKDGLKQLLDDIQYGQIDHVVVYSLDRLSRNFSDLYNICKLFVDNGILFSSVKEEIDSSDYNHTITEHQNFLQAISNLA